MKKQEFYVATEGHKDEIYIGEVPQIEARYSQRKTNDELMTDIQKVIELYLEELEKEATIEFIGIQKVVI